MKGVTRCAISIFAKLERATARVEKLKAELEMWVAHIPEEDMDEYVNITEKLRR